MQRKVMLFALKEVGQGPSPTNGISYQRPEKIDELIAAEAPSHETNLLRKRLKQSPRCQMTSNHDLIAQNTQVPKDAQEERFEPLCRD